MKIVILLVIFFYVFAISYCASSIRDTTAIQPIVQYCAFSSLTSFVQIETCILCLIKEMHFE